MATNAENQARYRQRHLDEGAAVRLNMIVSPHAKAALARLAGHYAVSQRALLERVITEVESDLVDGMSDEERRVYLK